MRDLFEYIPFFVLAAGIVGLVAAWSMAHDARTESTSCYDRYGSLIQGVSCERIVYPEGYDYALSIGALCTIFGAAMSLFVIVERWL